MSSERSNGGIVGTGEAEVGNIDSGRDAREGSPPRQRPGTPGHRRRLSPPWAWANCRSEFDWMDVHLPFFTPVWF